MYSHFKNHMGSTCTFTGNNIIIKDTSGSKTYSYNDITKIMLTSGALRVFHTGSFREAIFVYDKNDKEELNKCVNFARHQAKLKKNSETKMVYTNDKWVYEEVDNGKLSSRIIISILIGALSGLFSLAYSGGLLLSIMLAALGYGLSYLLIRLNSKDMYEEEEPVAKKIAIIAIAFSILLGIISAFVGTPTNPYSDVFDKHPNEWSEDEEEYVNDFFNWMDKENED